MGLTWKTYPSLYPDSPPCQAPRQPTPGSYPTYSPAPCRTSPPNPVPNVVPGPVPVLRAKRSLRPRVGHRAHLRVTEPALAPNPLPLPSALCPVPGAFCPVPFAQCLLPSAYCPVPSCPQTHTPRCRSQTCNGLQQTCDPVGPVHTRLMSFSHASHRFPLVCSAPSRTHWVRSGPAG